MSGYISNLFIHGKISIRAHFEQFDDDLGGYFFTIGISNGNEDIFVVEPELSKLVDKG